MQQFTFEEFHQQYVGGSTVSPEELRSVLVTQNEKFQPEGWMLLECTLFDSSWAGTKTILPYGPNNTFKEPPDHPISPRGLAADTSVVVGIMPIANFN